MEMLARVAEQDIAHMHVGTIAQVTPIGSKARGDMRRNGKRNSAASA